MTKPSYQQPMTMILHNSTPPIAHHSITPTAANAHEAEYLYCPLEDSTCVTTMTNA